MGPLEFALVAISSVVAVMNPISTIAVFSSLTEDLEPEAQRKIALKAMKISLAVLIFFAITGQLIFQVFNLQVYAFQIAGGILLISFALKMLSEKKVYSSDREDVSIIPLAFPLTAGIGTITTVILLFSESSTLVEASLVFVAIVVGVIVSYFGMIYAPKLFKVLGHDGLHVMSTLMAIIVLAIAVQFIINGVIAVIPYLPIE
ncbi:MAG: MarC family protein [Candidatus Bathyarchaeia archaeon]